jgi:hypothetical protein
MRYPFVFLFLLFLIPTGEGQVIGKITDTNGEPLPFANVYVQNTTKGTTSNPDGDYALQLDPGTYEIVYQYIGYQQQIRQVSIRSGVPTVLDVELKADALNLQTIEIKANAEDPAYAIIRKAIAKRKYYLEQVASSKVNVYMKGSVRILEAPEAILGEEVGDLGGNLDSLGRGILYLSESESVLYRQVPNNVKEIMTSSKVSGNANGFSFNSASDLNLNLYENRYTFNRPIISPIADGAMTYYRYELLGTLYDEDGRLINKIRITPKNPEGPTYHGTIYIIEDLWNIQSADLFITGASMNQPLYDTVFIQQTMIPVQEPDVWQLFSQNYTMKGGFLGFKIGGDFAAIYNDYTINPTFDEDLFDNQIFRVEEGANEKGLAYFDTIRPLPLTREESIDYVKKDSLEIIRGSKSFLDSMDRENNKFTSMNALLGYTYSQSYKRRYFSIGSPLSTIQFNTVQGWYGNMDIRYRQDLDERARKSWNVGANLSYGWSDKRFRYVFSGAYRFNRTHSTNLEVAGGVEARQFNAVEPITPHINTLYSLYGRRNFLKLYERSFGNIRFRHELFNGLLLTVEGTYAQRSALTNATDYSFGNTDRREYLSNDPTDPTSFAPAFPTHRALTSALTLRWRPGQKYISYPGLKFALESKWPDIFLHYRKGIPLADEQSQVDYDQVEFQIRKDKYQLGLAGYLGFNLVAGSFLNNQELFFMDYRHFRGNQTFIGNSLLYLEGFHLLPYYERSTDQYYAEGHWEYHFEGLILDRIPLIKKWNLSSVLGAHALYEPTNGLYYEFSFGIDNIGSKLLKIFRIDVVAAFDESGYQRTGFMIGVALPPILN